MEIPVRNIPLPYTELETIQIMLTETKNQLTRCELMERLYQRLNLRGNSYSQGMAGNQQQIKLFRETLKNLTDIHIAILEENDRNAKLEK